MQRVMQQLKCLKTIHSLTGAIADEFFPLLLHDVIKWLV